MQQFLDDCLKGKMIFELLKVVNVKNIVLRDLMLRVWSLYPAGHFKESAVSVRVAEFSVVAVEVKTFHRAACLGSL
jgi:hypothetical protein